MAIPASGIYEIDPVHTSAEFVAGHMMVTKVRGQFGDVSGLIVFAGDPAQSSVTARSRLYRCRHESVWHRGDWLRGSWNDQPKRLEPHMECAVGNRRCACQ